MKQPIPDYKSLILFDGVCNLCNNSVQFIIKRDKQNMFLFAPLQGETAQQILEYYKINTREIDSIILYQPNKGVYFKSTAALKISSKLGFPVNIAVIFMIIPAFFRNWVYDIIAKYRYKWFGKKEQCMIPTKELQEKYMP
jgi:predicted DCC family thiol-disulfide oxidoreductase YuxK